MLPKFSLIALLLVTVVAALLPITSRGEAANILIFGDSLSAGFGLDIDKGWTTLLAQQLRQEGYPYRVINASISGETTYGGLNRIDGELRRYKPTIVILALGANDGLRGLPLQETHNNLRKIIAKSRAHAAQLLLVGIRLPPNYGPAFTQQFEKGYQTLATDYHLPLLKSLLEGVESDPTLFQADGLHPNAAAQPRIMQNVWRQLQAMLSKP